MSTPEITVRKLSYHLSVTLLGRDEQGRQLYRCPGWGCGDTAHFDEDGRGHCASCEWFAAGVEALFAEAASVLAP